MIIGCTLGNCIRSAKTIDFAHRIRTQDSQTGFAHRILTVTRDDVMVDDSMVDDSGVDVSGVDDSMVDVPGVDVLTGDGE